MTGPRRNRGWRRYVLPPWAWIPAIIGIVIGGIGLVRSINGQASGSDLMALGGIIMGVTAIAARISTPRD